MSEVGAVQSIGKTEAINNLPEGQNGHYATLSVGPFTNEEAAKFYLENTMKKRIP